MAQSPEDVSERLRDAMYEVNDCWEFTGSESARAHIDDAIHHLKAARHEVDPPLSCGRCGGETVEVTIADGQRIGWYCGECHAITTPDGGLATYENGSDNDEYDNSS